MTWGAVAVAGATLVGGYMSSQAQEDAASEASAAQRDAASSQIAEQRRQFDQIQKILAPFVNQGTPAVEAQGVLAGLQGYGKQQEAIDAIQKSPLFTSLANQGESAILQNASATGGLRGGNTQGLLAQYRPALLNGMITDQFNRLGSLSSIGLGAATQTGAFGQQSTNAISQALQDQGSAIAGNALAQGKAKSDFYGDISKVAGMFGSYYGGGKV